jgi:hypothetical protein
MALIQELAGAGVPVLQQQLLGYSQTEGIVAAGSTRTDATALTATFNVVGTTGSGEGVTLPAATANAQTIVYVLNMGANTLKVYAAGANTINGVAGTTGVDVPTIEGGMFTRINAGTGWWFVPLGT